jgi:hypothetical protein
MTRHAELLDQSNHDKYSSQKICFEKSGAGGEGDGHISDRLLLSARLN